MTIRVPPDLLTAAAAWAETLGIKSRSETLVQLIALGLAAAPKRRRAK